MNYSRWSIWQANLDPVLGSEQGKTRPVLIISDDIMNELLPVINAIPITSRKDSRRIYPNEVLLQGGKFGLTKESIALCYQIRTLDKRRLTEHYGTIDNQMIQSSIIEAVCFQLAIEH
ncbi:MAG: type II toxin-antitoxin system PemK/MazF family toxin [Ignavibacteriae bacterium]|nr:type II toxin-antitoxin system PemK/MazF family toxin [Ignavibacteriota bacterium]